MNIGRLWKSSIAEFRVHDVSRTTYMRRRADEQLLSYLYEKNGSTFHDITSCELGRRESSIAYSGVLRRMTDSSYLVQRPRIVRCTIQLFRAFIFKRGRKKSIHAENTALSVKREEPDDSNRGNFFFHIEAKRRRRRTAELKNKFTPDCIRVPLCLGVINLYCAS